MSSGARPARSAIEDPRAWWRYACDRVMLEECRGQLSLSRLHQQVIGSEKSEPDFSSKEIGAGVDESTKCINLNSFVENCLEGKTQGGTPEQSVCEDLEDICHEKALDLHIEVEREPELFIENLNPFVEEEDMKTEEDAEDSTSVPSITAEINHKQQASDNNDTFVDTKENEEEDAIGLNPFVEQKLIHLEQQQYDDEHEEEGEQEEQEKRVEEVGKKYSDGNTISNCVKDDNEEASQEVDSVDFAKEEVNLNPFAEGWDETKIRQEYRKEAITESGKGEHLNPFAEEEDASTSFSSTNPFDTHSKASPVTTASSNPFDDCSNSSSHHTHTPPSLKPKPKSRIMPPHTSSNNGRKPMPTPRKSSLQFLPDEGLSRTSIHVPSSRTVPKANSERGLNVQASTSTSVFLVPRPMPPGHKTHSSSNLMPRPSSQSLSPLSSSSPLSASPVLDNVTATDLPAMHKKEEIQLIIMGFVKKEVELVIGLHPEFHSALSSLSTRILDNIRLQKSVKHIFQPPLDTRVGSWMPTESGSSNHIVFYIKVAVRGTNGFCYHIEKTYKEFLKLKKALSSPIFRIIPSGLHDKFEDNRSFFKNDTEEVLDERREMLDKWLRGICRLPELMISEKIHNIMFNFLLYEDNVDVNRLLL